MIIHENSCIYFNSEGFKVFDSWTEATSLQSGCEPKFRDFIYSFPEDWWFKYTNMGSDPSLTWRGIKEESVPKTYRTMLLLLK